MLVRLCFYRNPPESCLIPSQSYLELSGRIAFVEPVSRRREVGRWLSTGGRD